jgi:hypothetical protein
MDQLLQGSMATCFTGGIVLLGSLAAIMSTADSAIIACSNVVTIDLIKGWIWPACAGGVEPNAKQTMLVSKVASLIIVILGVLITNLGLDLSSLFVLQGALLCQAIPAYACGLYHQNIMDGSINTGMLLGTTAFFILEFTPGLKKMVVIGPGFIGLLVNVVVTFATQFALASAGKKCAPEDGKLTASEILRIMENNVCEPTKNPVLLVVWILVWMTPPWVFPSEGVCTLTFGAPTWFVYQMLLHGFITILLVYVIWSWKPAPPNARKEEHQGLKLSAVEMSM